MIETSSRSTPEFEFLRSGKISVVDINKSASNFHQNVERKGRRPKTSNAKKLSLEQVQFLYEVRSSKTLTVSYSVFAGQILVKHNQIYLDQTNIFLRKRKKK